MQSQIDRERVDARNSGSVMHDGDYVLYWMVAARRTRSNFGLQRALEWSRELRRPLLVFEALRVDYPWASPRFHQFVLQGMFDNARRFEAAGVTYYPHVETAPGAASGLMGALADRACVVVTDSFPAFFLPRMTQRFAARTSRRVEAIDSNGLIPLARSDRAYPTAHGFRWFVQREVPEDLTRLPTDDPLIPAPAGPRAKIPASVLDRWPATDLSDIDGALEALPLDPMVTPVETRGGSQAASERLGAFLNDGFNRYVGGRNHPDDDGASGLSPYLHFGHISIYEVFRALRDREDWDADRLADPNGKRTGWWGMSENAESFLDEIVTWRELGYHRCVHVPNYDRYEALPEWARTSLEAHEQDPREVVYSLDELDAAETYDAVWNAAQTQLRREGKMHNYLRMLWGKKILEWSPDPRTALDAMIELNNRYALDGRNPNSYTGILWVLGLHDRAWGPERPIYGKIRYMSSDNTKRKLRLKRYLDDYAPERS